MTPETDRDAIRATQRADIRDAIAAGATDAAAISAAVFLPVSVVEARLSEIRDGQ